MTFAKWYEDNIDEILAAVIKKDYADLKWLFEDCWHDGYNKGHLHGIFKASHSEQESSLLSTQRQQEALLSLQERLKESNQ